MANDSGAHVTRCPVAPEPLLGGASFDYADSFVIRLAHPDVHSAEEWIRVALDGAPAAMRRLISFVHARVARFRLGPSSAADHILGWRIVSSQPDVAALETTGPALRAVIVARRTSPTSAVATTFLFYKRPSTRLLWLVIGPLHRRVAPYLLARAAATMSTQVTR